MNRLVESIRESYPKPLIGIVGAAFPPKEVYDAEFGETIGYSLRKYVEKKGGFLFTGGVPGVGVDAYRGIVSACQPLTESSKEEPKDDRFFVLTPHSFLIELNSSFFTEDEEGTILSYEVPSEYRALAKKTQSKQLRIIHAGDDMDERRKYLSQVADVLVTINGGSERLTKLLVQLNTKNQSSHLYQVVELQHS